MRGLCICSNNMMLAIDEGFVKPSNFCEDMAVTFSSFSPNKARSGVFRKRKSSKGHSDRWGAQKPWPYAFVYLLPTQHPMQWYSSIIPLDTCRLSIFIQNLKVLYRPCYIRCLVWFCHNSRIFLQNPTNTQILETSFVHYINFRR